ncbi:MAG: amidohydrolase family protein [Caldisericia bacterium]|nr:amidohydrolase family protein [Caldisericia bacterium]
MIGVVYISFLIIIFVLKSYVNYITIFHEKGDIMLICGAQLYNPVTMHYDNFDVRIQKNTISDLQPWGQSTPEENETILPLHGAFLYPGFIDSHCHLMGTGEKYLCPSLLGIRSEQTLKQILQNQLCLQQSIVLRGWDEEKLGFVPNRHFLDALPLEYPVVLVRKCGHIATVNTVAVQLLHLSTFDGIDGTSIKEGVVRETALVKMKKMLPQNVSLESNYIVEGAKRFLRHGVTSVHSEDWNPSRLECFFQSNPLHIPCRLFEKVSIQNIEELTYWIQHKSEIQHKIASSFIHTDRMIKIYMDGSVCGETAYLSTPYLKSHQNGVCYHSVETLRQMILLANQNNLQVCIHTIGDKALENVLKSFAANPFSFLRHRIIHAQFASRKQILDIQDKQLELSIQPCFYRADLETVTKILDPFYLQDNGYPFKSYVEHDLLFSLSTDSPVESENPFHNIAYAEEFMSRKKAFYAYTVAGARQVFQEKVLGMIAVGYTADFFVLNKDLFKMTKKELVSTIPNKVFLDGKEMIGDIHAKTI